MYMQIWHQYKPGSTQTVPTQLGRHQCTADCRPLLAVGLKQEAATADLQWLPHTAESNSNCFDQKFEQLFKTTHTL